MKPAWLLSAFATRRQFLRHAARIGAALPLATGLGVPLLAHGQGLPPPFENKVGWAYSAVSGVSLEGMMADLARMKAQGCNVVYLGHNNPGDANADKLEPGLSFAVYYALREHTPSEASAFRIFQAITIALEASRRVGIEVVLPIAYQIQMGPEWNEQYPDQLRRDSHGDRMDHWESGETASPYSARYRADILEYYRWVNSRLLQGNPQVIAVNLGSEPMGSDFSDPARQEFSSRTGLDLDEADDLERGAFLSTVLADYANWSATAWQQVNPGVRSMMDFHIQRDTPFFPDFEAIFGRTPAAFIFSEDTHLYDLPDGAPTDPSEINLLYGMVRTLGWLSRVYAKPLLLWTAANAWGLSDEGDPLQEALLNLEIVAEVSRAVGGHLGMIMAWGWNLRGQGVYRDEGFFDRVDPDVFVEQIGRALVARRDTLARTGQAIPSQVIYVPREVLLRRVGAQRTSHLLDPFIDLRSVDFIHEDLVYLTDGPALEAARRAGSQIVSHG
jgi:hypothetical protein